MTAKRRRQEHMPSDRVLAAQRHVYTCGGDALRYPLECPFIAPQQRCAPISDEELQSKFFCWDRLPPGRAEDACVDSTSQRSAWSSERFAAAIRGRTLYFIGDGDSDQMWRSLMCLERRSLTRASSLAMTHFSKPSGLPDVAGGRLRCAELVYGARLCHTRQWSLAASLARAGPLAPEANATMLLGPSAHEANMTERAAVEALISWKARVELRATIVWRSRAYAHPLDRAPRGAHRSSCAALSSAQTSVHAASTDGVAAALAAAGVAFLDAAPSTLGAHMAHPVACRGRAESSASSFYDCKHYCSPGPIDMWNVRLLELVAPTAAPPPARDLDTTSTVRLSMATTHGEGAVVAAHTLPRNTSSTRVGRGPAVTHVAAATLAAESAAPANEAAMRAAQERKRCQQRNSTECGVP